MNTDVVASQTVDRVYEAFKREADMDGLIIVAANYIADGLALCHLTVELATKRLVEEGRRHSSSSPSRRLTPQHFRAHFPVRAAETVGQSACDPSGDPLDPAGPPPQTQKCRNPASPRQHRPGSNNKEILSWHRQKH